MQIRTIIPSMVENENTTMRNKLFYRCHTCSGDGRIVCETCDGHRQLKHFIQLTITLWVQHEFVSIREWNYIWIIISTNHFILFFSTNHDAHFTLESKDLPPDLEKEVHGVTLVDQTADFVCTFLFDFNFISPLFILCCMN